MTESIIEIDNLSFYSIFKEFTIKFKKNTFTTISGPNNCGKTTLIRILDGQIKTKNTVKYNQKNLEEYQITTLSEKIQTIIPTEITWINETIEQELYYHLENVELEQTVKKERYKEIIKQFKWTTYQNKKIKQLNSFQKIKLQLSLSLIKKPEILLLDDICNTMTKKQTKEIMDILTYYHQKEQITIIMTTSNLENTIKSDYLYIIDNSEIILQGSPLEVLEKDNILNRIGLELPFMIDLSVKLKDYDLIENIELDMDRMVDILWK